MGSDLVEVGDASHVGISIHAPRMGSDPGHGERRDIEGISIHAPRMGSDLDKGHVHHHPADFNPRSPDGERLAFGRDGDHEICDFNPRSPDGERRTQVHELRTQLWISIHAPRMGSDAPNCSSI